MKDNIIDLTSFVSSNGIRYFYNDIKAIVQNDDTFIIHFKDKDGTPSARPVSTSNIEIYNSILEGKAKFDLYLSKIEKTKTDIYNIENVTKELLETKNDLTKSLETTRENLIQTYVENADSLISIKTDATEELKEIYSTLQKEISSNISEQFETIQTNINTQLEALSSNVNKTVKGLKSNIKDLNSSIEAIDVDKLNTSIDEISRITKVFDKIL